MSFTEDLLNGICEYLASNPDATHPLTWRATGNYQPGETGLYALRGHQAHDRLGVAVKVYDSVSDPSLSDSTVMVQLDVYGQPRDVVRIVDDAFDRLQGFWGGTLGGVKVQSVNRQSGSPWGLETSGHLRQTENYYLTVHRPSSHRQ